GPPAGLLTSSRCPTDRPATKTECAHAEIRSPKSAVFQGLDHDTPRLQARCVCTRVRVSGGGMRLRELVRLDGGVAGGGPVDLRMTRSPPNKGWGGAPLWCAHSL